MAIATTAGPGRPEVYVRLPHSWCGASVDGVERVADAAERLGFDGVSVQDHILSNHGTSPCGHNHAGDDRDVFEPFATLSYVAARTSRVKLLTGVIVLPFRNPIWVAKTAATLDVLSRGRLVLGLGVGWPKARKTDGIQVMGVHADLASRESDLFDLPHPRWKVMNESLDVLHGVWADEPATYGGDVFAFEGLDMRPLPAQRPAPPIWIGGRADAALRRAALMADGWFPSQASVEVLAAGRARASELAAEAGRPAPRTAVNLFVSVDPNGDAAREVIRDGLAHRFRTEELLFESTVAGTPAQVRQRLLDYVSVGASAFDLKILPLATGPTLAQMDLLASEVLPALRETAVAA